MTKSAAISPTGSPRQPNAKAPWQEQDWQTLWVATQEQDRPWRSLAILPAGPGISNDSIVRIAATLSHTARLNRVAAIHVVDGTRVRRADVADFTESLRRRSEHEWVLIALASIMDNPSSVAIARAADCAMLCVLRGEMRTAHMKRTIDEVGNEHFLGSAVFRRPEERA